MHAVSLMAPKALEVGDTIPKYSYPIPDLPYQILVSIIDIRVL